MASIGTVGGSVGYLERVPEQPVGLPILFLHGVGSDKSVWAPQLEHFGKRSHAIAADYPGYGESDLVLGAGHDDYADAMVALLDALDIPRAHVCGLSLGGVVAIAMAARHPGRCGGLIIADSFALHHDGQAIHDRSLAAARQLGMRGLAEARVDALIAPGAPEGLREEVIETMAKIDPDAYVHGARAVWLADQRSRVASITHRSLILCGEKDEITPPLLSIKLVESMPNAQLRIIAGAGHLANAERPDDFNRVVDEFLSDLNEKA